MSQLAKQFYTQGSLRQKFSIFDLEFPDTSQSLVKLLKGISLLPGNQPATVKKALQAHLYIDFLFMAAAYPGIFLLCMDTSYKMEHFGRQAFAVLAWLQVVPWIIDILENIFLLKQLQNPVATSDEIHKLYQVLEIVKWGFACIGVICSLFGLLYFWMMGNFSAAFLFYFTGLALEIAVFLLINFRINKTQKKATC